MLAAANRLGDPSDFREVTRRGRRAVSATLVVHVRTDEPVAGPGSASRAVPVRVGLVVSKAVGNSVVRNRVKRRLRHLLRERLQRLPGDARVVVRALPSAAHAPSAVLGRDLERCLARAGVLPGSDGSGVGT